MSSHLHTPHSLQPTLYTLVSQPANHTCTPQPALLPHLPFISMHILHFPTLYLLHTLHTTVGAYLTPFPSPSHSIFHLTHPLTLLPSPPLYLFTPSPLHPPPTLISRQSDELDRAPVEWEVVVTLDKEKFLVRATWEEDGFTVEIDGGERVVLNNDVGRYWWERSHCAGGWRRG